MAGTISLSLSQQFDAQGAPLSGGKLYFFQSGTTTPQNAFQDFALAIVHPNPIVLDASGRVPAFYLADGFIKIRLADEDGVTVIAADGLLVVGPSSGGGGGTAGDPNALLQTGDIKARFGSGTLAGFVRCNGLTIGSATSGATEALGASANNQALFEYLWNTSPNLTVSGGRGGNSNGDWLANKTIALPDLRGRTIAGMDDMGATAANRLTSVGLGTSAIILGAAGATETITLTSAQLPAHTHPLGASATIAGESGHTHAFSGTTGAMSANSVHSHTVTAVPSAGGITGGGVGSAQSGANTETSIATSSVNLDHTHTVSGTTGTGSSHTHTISGNTQNSTGGGGVTGIVQPTIVMTFYIKL